MNPIGKMFAIVIASMMTVGAYAADTVDDVFSMLLTYERPSFPAALSSTSITHGYATLAVAIKADGTIDDVIALDASHDAFADAAMQAVTAWRFKPNKRAPLSEATQRRVVHFEFEQEGTVALLSNRDASKAVFARATNKRI
jgi:TonB family protein